MYLHKTKNGHYTPPCCYFSGELEVVEGLRHNGRFEADIAHLIDGAVLASGERNGEPEEDGTG